VKPTGALLIVDDDEFLLRYLHLVLVRAGYGVLTARNGEEAWKLMSDQRHQIRLLLTDIVMPGSFDGFELAERTRKLRPDLPVLLMTGALPNDSPRAEVFVREGTLLRKPFYPEQVLTIVRENLESAEGSKIPS
jgi:two-component system, cell cycle sensor histidine kinase and response regulator CckA